MSFIRTTAEKLRSGKFDYKFTQETLKELEYKRVYC